MLWILRTLKMTAHAGGSPGRPLSSSSSLRVPICPSTNHSHPPSERDARPASPCPLTWCLEEQQPVAQSAGVGQGTLQQCQSTVATRGKLSTRHECTRVRTSSLFVPSVLGCTPLLRALRGSTKCITRHPRRLQPRRQQKTPWLHPRRLLPHAADGDAAAQPRPAHHVPLRRRRRLAVAVKLARHEHRTLATALLLLLLPTRLCVLLPPVLRRRGWCARAGERQLGLLLVRLALELDAVWSFFAAEATRAPLLLAQRAAIVRTVRRGAITPLRTAHAHHAPPRAVSRPSSHAPVRAAAALARH